MPLAPEFWFYMAYFLQTILALALMLAIPVTGDAKPRKRPAKRKYLRTGKAPGLLSIERQQLLRATPSAALKAELEHRWLSLFTLEELQREAERRGIK